MTEAEWARAALSSFGFRLCGQVMDDVNDRGEAITDDTLLVLLNAGPAGVTFALPTAWPRRAWEVLLDTAAPDEAVKPAVLDEGAAFELMERSVVLLRACDRGA
jgi:glycogen operon protein